MTGLKVCNAIGCGSAIPETRLMCEYHWIQLPIQIREEITEGYYHHTKFSQLEKLHLALYKAKNFLNTKTK